MRNQMAFGFALAAILATGPILAKEKSYLCIGDVTVGVKHDKVSKKWVKTNYNSGTKYLLSRSDGSWSLKLFGESAQVECDQGFDKKGFIRCGKAPLFEFWMIRKTFRYQVIAAGYLAAGYAKQDPLPEKARASVLEIGKCSSF